MNLFHRDELPKKMLPGRAIQDAVGKISHSHSGKMTMGFAHYSAASGPMEPHQHAEEIVYVLDADRATVRCGAAKDGLGEPRPLAPGSVMHFPELEWHVFEYGEGGFLDAIFFYGQVDNIRPEEMKRS